MTWRGGAIASVSGSTSAAISLSQLDGGVFDAIRIDAGGAPDAVICGEEVQVGSPRQCSAVVFRDCAIGGVGSTAVTTQQYGVRFTNATGCGVVRGAIVQIAGVQAVGVRLASQSARCFADGVNLSGATAAKRVILEGASPRVRDLYGYDLTVVAPRGTGTPVGITMTNRQLTGSAGGQVVTPSGGGALTTITVGTPGDLLVVQAAAGQTVTAKIGTSLALHADRPLSNGVDTLALVNTGAGLWSELAYSDNT